MVNTHLVLVLDGKELVKTGRKRFFLRLGLSRSLSNIVSQASQTSSSVNGSSSLISSRTAGRAAQTVRPPTPQVGPGAQLSIIFIHFCLLLSTVINSHFHRLSTNSIYFQPFVAVSSILICIFSHLYRFQTFMSLSIFLHKLYPCR